MHFRIERPVERTLALYREVTRRLG
jgi:hypothetical protein